MFESNNHSFAFVNTISSFVQLNQYKTSSVFNESTSYAQNDNTTHHSIQQRIK